MGNYLVTAPDGRKYRITGDTPEGAVEALKRAGSSSAPMPPQTSSPVDAAATGPWTRYQRAAAASSNQSVSPAATVRELTLEQKRALALARARKARAEAEQGLTNAPAAEGGPWTKYQKAGAPIPTRGADSSLSVAPGTTPEQAARIPEGMVYDPQTGGYVDTALAAQRGGAAGGLATSYLGGTPFVGSYVDEAAGAIDRALTGANPEIAQETVRQAQQQFCESNSKAALGASIAGGVVGSLPMLAAAPAVAASAPASMGGGAHGDRLGAGRGRWRAGRGHLRLRRGRRRSAWTSGGDASAAQWSDRRRAGRSCARDIRWRRRRGARAQQPSEQRRGAEHRPSQPPSKPS